jgi:hypothetical protein
MRQRRTGRHEIGRKAYLLKAQLDKEFFRTIRGVHAGILPAKLPF